MLGRPEKPRAAEVRLQAPTGVSRARRAPPRACALVTKPLVGTWARLPLREAVSTWLSCTTTVGPMFARRAAGSGSPPHRRCSPSPLVGRSLEHRVPRASPRWRRGARGRAARSKALRSGGAGLSQPGRSPRRQDLVGHQDQTPRAPPSSRRGWRGSAPGHHAVSSLRDRRPSIIGSFPFDDTRRDGPRGCTPA